MSEYLVTEGLEPAFARRIEPLTGGVANEVWSVRVNGHLAVGRLGSRSDSDLAWETGLLQDLDREGLTVPLPIPTTDGRLFADDVVPSGTARPEIASTSTQHCIVCRFSANSAEHSPRQTSTARSGPPSAPRRSPVLAHVKRTAHSSRSSGLG